MRRFSDVLAIFNFFVLVGILFVLGFRRDASTTNLEPFEQTIAYQSQLIRDKTDEIIARLDTAPANLQGEQLSRGRFEGIALRLEAIERVLRGRSGQPAGQRPDSE